MCCVVECYLKAGFQTKSVTCEMCCCSLRQGDICSSDIVNYVIRKEKVDTIMNFAAQTHVDNSFGNSFTFTETNVLGTHVLLEAAKTFGIKLFLHVSTDEVYGEGDEDGKASHEVRLVVVES